MDVSILIVGWNSRHFLYDCLKSVYAKTKGIQYEIIYIDNGSKDHSIEMVKKEFPQVKIIENKENLGFTKANNQGIKIARGRYILLLNSDTIILDNAIANTVKFADEHPAAAVVGCKVFESDRKSIQRTAFQFYSTLTMIFDVLYLRKLFLRSKFFNRKRYAGWNFDTVREVDVIIGCFSLVRMKAIQQVGVMNEIFFMYGDDKDWCYRFVKAGWKVMFTPEPRIIHHGGGSRRGSIKRKWKLILQLYGGGLIFTKMHYSHITYLLCKLLTACFFFFRIPYWIIKGILKKEGKLDALLRAKYYFIGGVYTLLDWTKLLINQDEVKKKFYMH